MMMVMRSFSVTVVYMCSVSRDACYWVCPSHYWSTPECTNLISVMLLWYAVDAVLAVVTETEHHDVAALMKQTVLTDEQLVRLS